MTYERRLALTVVAYAVLHHLGLLPEGLGSGPERTRVTDWLDLLVPWLVLAPAGWTLVAARAEARTWTWFAAGALAYASGHGIHLAANSVNNAAPGQTAHLWDEAVGHAIWYAGVAVVVFALARTMAGRPRPPLVGYLLAVAVGVTWATNAVGTDNLSLDIAALVVAAALAAYGWWHRDGLASTLLVGFTTSAGWLVMHVMLAT